MMLACKSLLLLAGCCLWMPLIAAHSINVNSNMDTSNLNSNKFCSRAHSKFVREYFARALLPIYHKYAQPVPEKCPFSPLHDIYHYQENNKTKLDVNKWKCEMCGKFFISEEYLDQHFELKHNSSLQKNNNSHCLANYCRIFRCEVLMKNDQEKPKCYESIMTTLRNKCKSHLELCIPRGISYPTRNKLMYELSDSLCSYLTCKKYFDPPTFMSKGPSFLIIFFVVMCVVMCIIAYGVISHTDLIFDENELIENDINAAQQAQSESNAALTNAERMMDSSPLDAKNNPNLLRHRHIVNNNNNQ